MTKLVLAAVLFLTQPLFAGTAKLAWDASTSPGIAGYNLYRRTGSNPFVKVNPALILTVPTNASPYLDTTVPDTGQQFEYRVTAVNAGGSESTMSNSAFFVVAPTEPTNLRVVP